MKALTSLLLTIFLLASLNTKAQTSVDAKETTIKFDKAQRPCLQVNLDPEPKTLKKAWRKYLKDEYDFKLKGIGFLKNKDLLSAEQIVVKELSTNQMDFYTQIVESKTGSEMNVFVRYGYDIYISQSSHPDQFITLNNILDGFLKEYLPKYYADQIKDTEKRVKKLEKETKGLSKDIKKDTKKIEKLNKEIKDREKDLESNNELLKEAKTKLESRKDKLKRIKSELK